MISAGTLHVISTELTIGMFALSGVAFLLCLLKKGPESREAVAHWALLGGLIATPMAIISGVNAAQKGNFNVIGVGNIELKDKCDFFINNFKEFDLIKYEKSIQN